MYLAPFLKYVNSIVKRFCFIINCKKKMQGDPFQVYSIVSSYLSRVTRKPVFGAAAKVDSNRSAQPQKLNGGLKFWR